jgi:acyl carrier protein
MMMLTKEQIYNEIVRVLRNELVIDAELRSDTGLETLGLDSIQLMQLFVYMEQTFSFEFSPDSTISVVRNFSLEMLTQFVHESANRSLNG